MRAKYVAAMGMIIALAGTLLAQQSMAWVVGPYGGTMMGGNGKAYNEMMGGMHNHGTSNHHMSHEQCQQMMQGHGTHMSPEECERMMEEHHKPPQH